MDQLGQSFAIRTEVGVVANSTFVSVSHNVLSLVGAKRPITENANVILIASWLLGHWLVQRN